MHERPDDQPIEGEYQEPTAPQADTKRSKARGIGAIAATLGVLALKFKSLLLILVNLKWVLVLSKLLAVSWTFLLSLWLYVVVFGWRFAAVLIFVLLAHEMGHYAAFRAYGLPARLPVFVPFFGAFTAGTPPQDLEQDAYIALAGPLTGLGLAALCYGIGLAFTDAFWYACASVSAFLNLFNMLPIPPFDGGRVIGAVSPFFWIAGIVLFVVAAIFLHIPLLFVIVIAFIGAPTMIAALRGNIDPRAAAMTTGARVRISLWYLATLIALAVIMGQAQSVAPRGVL